MGAPLSVLFTLAVVSVPLYVIGIAIHSYFISPLRKVPGPALTRFTNWVEVYYSYRGDYEKRLLALHRKYGAVVRLAPNLFSFNGLEDMRKIYKYGGKWNKPDWYDAFASDTAHPTLICLKDEAEHALRKRQISSLYSMSTLVHYEPGVDRVVDVCVDRLQALIGTSHDKLGAPFDLPEFLQCYAFDVVSAITFDESMDLMTRGPTADGVLAAIRSIIYVSSIMGPVSRLFTCVQRAINFVAHFVPNANTPLRKLLTMIATKAEYYQRTMGITKAVSDKSEPFIAKAVGLVAEGKMDTRSILDTCGSNYVAGSDTTGIALSVIVWHIYHHPDKLARLRSEVDALGPGRMTFAQAQALPYLNAVVSEAMRLHPSIVTISPREVPAGGEYLAGYYFPHKTQVGVSAWSIHRNPKVSGPDADVFRPERWLDETMSAETKVGMSFAFSGGTRSCLGKNIALLEIMKVIPEIVRNIDFKFAESTYTNSTCGFVWPRYHVWIRGRPESQDVI
ncbi:cytochrome protein [Diaporthe sp. PMI_573]|nr:cytochrome protein [Diaporthaceae sp. PMI_573]